MALLEVNNLQRQVDGRLLWQDISFTLEARQRLMLLGPSGSGKSLLMRALAGLDPLEGGEVTFLGKPQRSWAMPAYRSSMMYLPQRAVTAGETVEDTLRQPFVLKVHAGTAYRQEAAVRLVSSLGRTDAFLRQETANLSGGEAQLTALTRALLLNPTILLLDEATSALDVDTARQAEALLTAWVGAGERALVMVSHDPAQRERLGTAFLPLGSA